MVLGAGVATVQDYGSPMEGYIPSSGDYPNSYSTETQGSFNGTTTYQTHQQEHQPQYLAVKHQNAISTKRPYVLRCSSLERFTKHCSDFHPSLPLSAETHDCPGSRHSSQHHIGYHREEATDDAIEACEHQTHSFQPAPRLPLWTPALSQGSSSQFPGEVMSCMNCPHISNNQMVESEYNIEQVNSLQQDGAQAFIPGHVMQQDGAQAFIPGHVMQQDVAQAFIPGHAGSPNEPSSNLRLFTWNRLEPPEISFNALSPICATTSPFNYNADNSSVWPSSWTTSKPSLQSSECCDTFSRRHATSAHQSDSNLPLKSRFSSLKLASQSYSDISRVKTRHSLKLSKSSSGDFANHIAIAEHPQGEVQLADNFSVPQPRGPPFYSSFQRRCSSDHFLRRTQSHEPTIQEIQHVTVRAVSQSEIESEYVVLDHRYVPPNSTRLYGVTEGVVCFHGPQPESFAPSSSVAGSTLYNGRCHVAEGSPNTVHAVPALANIERSRESTPKSSPLSAIRKQAPRPSSGSLRTVAETIGSLFSNKTFTPSSRNSGSPKGDTSTSAQDSLTINSRRSSRGDVHKAGAALSRSRSLSDLRINDLNRNYSDDEDGDEFGFLTYPVSFVPSSAVMNKAKSPSPGSRPFTKRWRTNKSNAGTAVTTSVAMWTPGCRGSYTWSSVSGRKVQVCPASLLSLTEPERLALQKVALVRLQSMDIGCTISVPKDNGEFPRAKKSPLSLKRRSKSVSSSALDTMLKDGASLGLAFGIPLLRCILNDRELGRGVAVASLGDALGSSRMRTRNSDNFLVFRSGRKSSSSSQGSADNVAVQRLESLTVPSNRRTTSSDSLSESESSYNTNSSLIDALSLSTSNPSPTRPSSLATDSSGAQVPYVVKSCFKHIEAHGLQTLGIFRVGSSRKRVKQLRTEFDCGRELQLTEEHNPHDVGALLKEFFRDLPEPLLTRELYLPFLHAERIKDEQKRHTAISLLICMLPVPNRDTLWALLRFLAVVSHHASDVTQEKGTIVAGHKMDSHNLATLFGPNILHRAKVASDKELMFESVERVEQSKEVIEVVKDMIDNYHELFQISASLRDDALRLLVESKQEAVNKILRHLANQNQIETDPESMSSVFEDSCSSPVLYHCTSSDVDLTVLARKQTTHHSLRVAKSEDDSLDSPISDFLGPHFSEHQAQSPIIRDNLMTSGTPPILQQKFDSSCSYPSQAASRIPVLRMSYESKSPEVVLRSKSETINIERPYSEGFNRSLNIPQQLYHRQSSNPSASSALPSPLISYNGSDNVHFGQWMLSTQPLSCGSSPKQLYQCSSSSSPKQLYQCSSSSSPKQLYQCSTSSSTSIATSRTSQFDQSEGDCENNIPFGSEEWERERWKQWEKIAAQRKTVETEQETLV